MFEIWRATVRARGLRPIPVAAGASMILMAVALVSTDSRVAVGLLVPFSFIYLFVISAGLIGADVENGSTQLLLSRAVTRNAYLAGRLLGVLSIGLAFLVLMFGATLLAMAARGTDRHEEVLLFALNLGFRLAWASSVIFCCSCLLPSYGDVVGYFGMISVAGGFQAVASEAKVAWIASLARVVSQNLFNTVQLLELSWHSVPLADLSRYASNVALALLLGTLVFRAREFSYGSG